jgi:ABC-type nickel/cobalt efflux system permease component RcnA
MWVAIGTAAIACGLGLWWLWDKVHDSVNANPRKDAEINPAQSPHDDDQPPQK